MVGSTGRRVAHLTCPFNQVARTVNDRWVTGAGVERQCASAALVGALGCSSTSPLGGRNLTKDTSLKTVTFDKSKLLDVSKDGLEYVDDQGCRYAIDFHTCRENVQRKLKMPERLWARDPNYVGFRDILAKPPHITLATDPPTRFVFPMPGPSVKDPGKKSSQLEPSDFYEFEMRLFSDAGVKTFDMT
jgi:hypothetical protein